MIETFIRYRVALVQPAVKVAEGLRKHVPRSTTLLPPLPFSCRDTPN